MEQLWFPLLGWLLTFITISGNGLVIFLIARRRKLRTRTNWFVFSLAVADLGVGVTHFPRLSACDIHQLCGDHVLLATSTQSVKIFFICASGINLATLVLDRYLAIVKPFTYIAFTRTKRIAFLIAMAWGIPGTVILPSYLILKLAVSGKTHTAVEIVFWAFVSAFNTSVCAFLLVATVWISLIARRHAKQNAAMFAQLKFNYRITQFRIFKTQEVASTKLVAVVVVFFVISYLLDVYDTMCYLGLCERYASFSMATKLLILTNSAVNPVTYAFLKREIRNELKRMFCRK